MNEYNPQELSAIFDTISLAVAFAKQGVIVRVNRAFEELFGYSGAEVIGQSWNDFRALVFEGEISVASEGVGYCLRMHSKQGKKFWAGVNGQPVDPDNPEQGTVWNIQDVTIQQQVSLALKQAQAEAQEATRDKGKFLANVSHEIRTPLNVIIGATSLVDAKGLDDPQRSHLANIKDSAAYLLDMLDDLLDYSKIESGYLQLENRPFDFSGLVGGIVKNFTQLATEKGLYLKSELQLSTTARPSGDGLRLRQILVNLTNNALKFTREGGVTIKASLAEENGAKLTANFQVHDTGIGIAEETQKLIFTDFAQANRSTYREYGGTGLGLPICRQLVKLMRGKIELESSPGKGSVFSVTVPLERQAQSCNDELSGEEQQTTESPRQDKRPKKILVVDDHITNRQLATAILEEVGHTVTSGANGLEALEILSENYFDHVLMDLQMPVMDGIATTGYLRQLEDGLDPSIPDLEPSLKENLAHRLRGRHLHIIAATASSTPPEKDFCVKTSFDHFLSKPYNKDILLEILTNYHQETPAADKRCPAERLSTTLELEEVSRHQIWQNITARFELDSETATQIIDTYAQTVSENLSNASQALAQKNYPEMEQQAHAIKGAFLNLGLEQPAKAAGTMESMASGQKHDGFGELLAAIQKSLQPFLN